MHVAIFGHTNANEERKPIRFARTPPLRINNGKEKSIHHHLTVYIIRYILLLLFQVSMQSNVSEIYVSMYMHV